jgi:hypothetical protein
MTKIDKRLKVFDSHAWEEKHAYKRWNKKQSRDESNISQITAIRSAFLKTKEQFAQDCEQYGLIEDNSRVLEATAKVLQYLDSYNAAAAKNALSRLKHAIGEHITLLQKREEDFELD